MARLSLSLLGSFQATLDGTPISEFRSDKTRALLAYLALEADRPHRRDALTGLLWPDVPDQAARNSLRQSLHRLRQAIGDTDAQPTFVTITSETVQFNSASDVWLDVTAFDALLTAIEAHSHRRIEACAQCVTKLREAAELYRGDFLQGFILADSVAFSEWAAVRREWLHQRALEALFHLAEYHRWRGEYEPASKCVHRQLELEPWREEAHRQLMGILARRGERSAALAQYEACRRVLAEELGVEPSEQTRTLFARIQTMGDTQRRPLPPQATPFVGRKEELAEVASRLADPDCRLLTLVGAGGIGKTRVALRAAEYEVKVFLDGVYFIPLAPLHLAEHVVTAIAGAAGILLERTMDPKTQLLASLRSKEMLLVLDNFEHLPDGAELVAEILRHAPETKILATSRARLNLQEEWLFEVEGLDYPEDEATDDLESYQAVQLFVECVRRAHSRYTISEAEKACVGRLCRLLEGMPLGIELASAWMPALPCATIAQEIERNLDFLATSLRNVPGRHRSLRAAFEHSWQLLREDERRVLRQLSVFRGGFAPAAAKPVAGATSAILAALVGKSLLRRDLNIDGPERFDLHELIRQYTREQLAAAGEIGQTNDRHLDFFLDLAEDIEPKLLGPEQASWLKRLEQDHDNLRAALEWSLQGERAPAGVRLTGALWRFWLERGHISEGRKWLAAAIAHNDEVSPLSRAKTLHGAGELTWAHGDNDSAKALFEQELMLRREIDDRNGIASALKSLGIVALYEEKHARATEFFEECLALFRELGDTWGVSTALTNLGVVAHNRGDYAVARPLLEESLALQRALKDDGRIGLTLINLGWVMLNLGDDARAAALFEESLTLHQAADDRWGIALTLDHFGLIALQRGDAARAMTLFQESLALYRALEDRVNVTIVHARLGQAELALNHSGEAAAHLRESLILSRELTGHSQRAAVFGLEGWAALLVTPRRQSSDALRAAILLGAAAALREARNIPIPPYERDAWEHVVAVVRDQLHSSEYAAAWAEGRAMTLEQAIAYALQDNDF